MFTVLLSPFPNDFTCYQGPTERKHGSETHNILPDAGFTYQHMVILHFYSGSHLTSIFTPRLDHSRMSRPAASNHQQITHWLFQRGGCGGL